MILRMEKMVATVSSELIINLKILPEVGPKVS